MAKTNKPKQIIGLPTMGAIKEVELSTLHRNPELEALYPTSRASIDRMKSNLSEHGLNNPLIVYQRENRFILFDGKTRWDALKEIGILKALVVVKDIKDADVIPAAILTNQRKQKTWVMRGKEVTHLLEYATRNLTELQRNDESITRANDWVAQMLGFKAQCRVDQLRKIIAFDKDLLEFVDTGEISFSEAYNKSVNKPTPPKVKDHDKDSFKCNCPLHATCPTLQAYLNEQKGGNNENQQAA